MEFQQQPFTPPPAQPTSFAPPVSAVNPVVRAVKERGRSPLFLVLCLLQSAVTVATLALSFVGVEITSEFSFSDGGGNSVEVSVLPILFTVAFWIIRYACCSDESPFISTGGLKFVKVITTIQLVLYYILGVCLPIVFFSLLVSQEILGDLFGNSGDYIDDIPSDSFMEGIMNSMFMAIVIVLFIAVVFMIVFTHVLRRAIATLTENCEGYLTDRSIPMFLVVACYIMAGFQFLGGLGYISQVPLVSAVVIANGAVFVLGGVLLTKYRNTMEELRKTSMESAYFSAPTPPPFQNM